MKARYLSAVAVAALLMGPGFALAADRAGQGSNADTQQGNAAAMQHNQGGDAGSDSSACPPDQCPQATTGEAPGTQAPGTMQSDQAQGGQMQQDQSGQADQQPLPRRNRTQAGANGQNGSGDQNQMQTGQNQNNADQPATTGSVRAPAEITTEQRTKIRTSLHETHVKPVAHVDFDINVGVAVPNTIVLAPLPATIVEIVPAYQGYEFFELADGTIVIVDPNTLQIVYVLSA